MRRNNRTSKDFLAIARRAVAEAAQIVRGLKGDGWDNPAQERAAREACLLAAQALERAATERHAEVERAMRVPRVKRP
jgi:hypothetical protein